MFKGRHLLTDDHVVLQHSLVAVFICVQSMSLVFDFLIQIIKPLGPFLAPDTCATWRSSTGLSCLFRLVFTSSFPSVENI